MSEKKSPVIEDLLSDIRSCKICENVIPHEIRPVLQASRNSKILIAGQAPGRFVHESGIPWNDASGRLLRQWMGVSDEEFYNPELFAIIPAGFCYPGKGKSGDNPPPPICAATWQKLLLDSLTDLDLILAIGSYSIKNHLGKSARSTLAETIKNFRDYLPEVFPLVHPSPRNKLWLKNNPWFERDVIPALRKIVHSIL